MSEQHPSTQQYQRAIQIVEQIEQLEAELKEVLSGSSGSAVEKSEPSLEPTSKTAGKRKGKRAGRVVSPEGRARMAAAQRARWAKSRKS